MAEVATGAGIALAAEEVLSTTLQAGVATHFLAKPTQPLKATFTRIAVINDDELHRRSLTRSKHTLTIVNSKAYIFGGETADGAVASNDLHIVNLAPEENKDPEYQLIPAIAKEDGGEVPRGRTGHAACAFEDGVVIYGGTSADGQAADDGKLWLFNPPEKTWKTLYSFAADGPVLTPSIAVRIFALGSSLILLMGTAGDGISTIARLTPSASSDKTRSPYETLPPPPAPSEPSNACLHDDHLYVISSADPMSSHLHTLPLGHGQTTTWTTLTFPTNPLVPGPRARHSGALLPFTTGYGRNYLLYLLGARSAITTSPLAASTFAEQDLTSPTCDAGKEAPPEPTQWSDTWTLQLPSSNLEPRARLNIADAIKPAKLKDAIRSGVGAETGEWTWSEVEVCVPDDLGEAERGKLHPGTRALFGADVQKDGNSVVFWSGEDAEGEKVGDGWVVRLE